MTAPVILSASTLCLVFLVFGTTYSSMQDSESNPNWKEDLHLRKENSYSGKIAKRSTSGNKKAKLADHYIVNRLLQDYTEYETPDAYQPTQVRIGVYINAFNSISENTMQYSIMMYLRQAWKDKRLKYDYETVSSWSGSEFDGINEEDIPKILILSPDIIKERVFTPDTFFRNEKGNSLNREDIDWHNSLMRINQTGHVWFVRKVSTTFSCPMKLQKYPMDTQMCPMLFESFKYTMDSIYFKWLDSPVDVDPSIELPHYTLKATVLYDCSQNYTAGAFPCLEIRFVLRRDIGYVLLQVFTPSILMVMLSWCVFWTKMDIGAAVGLEVVLVLAVVIMESSSIQSLPRTSYIRAIDIWYFACLFMICGALIVCIIINSLSSGKQSSKGTGMIQQLKLKLRLTKDQEVENDAKQKDEEIHGATEANCDDKTCQKRATSVNQKARFLFPITFLIFNIIYWILYTLPHGQG